MFSKKSLERGLGRGQKRGVKKRGEKKFLWAFVRQIFFFGTRGGGGGQNLLVDVKQDFSFLKILNPKTKFEGVKIFFFSGLRQGKKKKIPGQFFF